MSANQPFAFGRRKFWRALLQEVFIMSGTVKGGQGFKLADLDSMSDEQLALVKPAVNAKCRIFVEQGYVCSRDQQDQQTETALKLFPVKQDFLVLFNMFNGQRTLEEIGRQASLEMGWEQAEAFTRAKTLFLELAHRLVCLPQNSPEPDN